MTSIQQQIASDLLAIKAVTFSPQKPYHWASGIVSPIYTDNRKTIGFPTVRTHIADGLAQLISEHFPAATVIAGVATAGIPHAALVADRLGLPMNYVRPKPKDHGTGRQVEGQLEPGDRVVLVDDLISTGGSVLQAAQAVREAGAEVLGVAAIFSYELPDSDENFRNAKTKLVTLTTYTELVTQASQAGQMPDSEIAALTQWREDPWHWSAE